MRCLCGKEGVLNLKTSLKHVRILLPIVVSLLVLALPVYLRCTHLSQTKFVSSDLSFENSDQEEGLPGNEKELKVYGPSTFLTVFLFGTNLFYLSFHLFPQVLSLRERIAVLRCWEEPDHFLNLYRIHNCNFWNLWVMCNPVLIFREEVRNGNKSLLCLETPGEPTQEGCLYP